MLPRGLLVLHSCWLGVLSAALLQAFGPPSEAHAGCLDYRGEGIQLIKENILPGAYAVAIDQPYLYAKQGAILQILELQGEEEVPLGSLTLESGVTLWTLSGSFLYGTSYEYDGHAEDYWDTTLHVFDVSDPMSPREASQLVVFPIDRVPTGGLATCEGYAYVSGSLYGVGGYGEIAVVDLTTPEAPELVGYLDDVTARDIEVVGDRAYLTDPSHDALRILDLSDPSSPQLIGSVGIPAVRDVAIHDGYAYVGTSNGQAVYVVRLSPVGAPQIVGALEPFGYDDLQVHDSVLFGRGGAVWAADVSDPAAPALLGTSSIGGGSLVISGQSLYTSYSISRFDVSDPAVTMPISITSAGDVEDIVVMPPYAYVCVSDQFTIYDVSDAAALQPLGSIPTSTGASGSAIRGDLAYVVDSNALRTVDISDPSNPQLVSSYATGPNIKDIELLDDYAILCDDGGLRVIDVSDVQAPTTVGFISLPGMASMEWAGSLLYGVDGLNGLRIIDVSNPYAPTLVRTLLPPQGHRCISADVAGDLTCVLWLAANGISAKLHTLDSTDPALPVLRSELSTVADLVVVAGNHAYLPYDWRNRIIDLSNPDEPAAIGDMYVPAASFSAPALDADHLYFAADDSEIIVLNLQCAVASVMGSASGAPTRILARPNPFSSTTAIRYEIPEPARVELGIFDAAGRLVRRLAEGDVGSVGPHEAVWDGCDEQGYRLPAGTYFIRFGATSNDVTARNRGKLVLAR